MCTFFTYLKFLLSYFNPFKQLPCQFSQDYEFILDLVSLHFVLGANQRTDTSYSVELCRYVYEKTWVFPNFRELNESACYSDTTLQAAWMLCFTVDFLRVRLYAVYATSNPLWIVYKARQAAPMLHCD